MPLQQDLIDPVRLEFKFARNNLNKYTSKRVFYHSEFKFLLV